MFQTFLNPEIVCEIDGIEFYQYPNSERYLISKCGKVYDAARECLLKQSPASKRRYSAGYNSVTVEKKRTSVHRMLAITFIANTDNKQFIDHINGNTLDNSLTNLRWCTIKENTQNRRSTKMSKSSFIGVSQYRNGKWRATIKINGFSTHIGYYHTQEDAARAYNVKAAEAGYMHKNIVD